MLLCISLKIIGHLKISWLTMPPRASVAFCVGRTSCLRSLSTSCLQCVLCFSMCLIYIYIYTYVCIHICVYIYMYILYYIVCIHLLLASLSCYGNRIMQFVVAVRSMARAMTRSPGPSMRRWNTSGGLFQRLWNSSGNIWENQWVE